jgi:hypothetical protein
MRQPPQAHTLRRMYFRRSLTMAAILAAGIAGTGVPAPARADVADDSFLQALDGQGLQYGTLEKAISVAKGDVCGQLDANPGESINDVVSGVATDTNLSIADSSLFTGSAIAAYCPQYTSIANATPTVDGPSNVPIS